MISFAAIAPHSPLLIPGVSKDKSAKLAVTKQSLDDLDKKLSKINPDALLVISAPRGAHHSTFSIIAGDKYVADFKEFGDFETKMEFFPDSELTEKIRHAAIDNNIPFTLSHRPNLDYGFAVPLYYLARNKNFKIIPFCHTGGELKNNFEMGRLIKGILLESNKKIGIIASGNLSHGSNEKSPLGFSKAGKEFNDKFVELLETKNTAGLLSMDKKTVAEANESVLLPAALLLGIIEKINYKPQIFSTEAPLGVGYLVCNFKFL